MPKALPYYEQVFAMSNHSLETNPQDYWARLDRLTSALVLDRDDVVAQDLETVLQQVTVTAPLETAVSELTNLRNAPHPLVKAEAIITRMNAAIAKLKGA